MPQVEKHLSEADDWTVDLADEALDRADNGHSCACFCIMERCGGCMAAH